MCFNTVIFILIHFRELVLDQPKNPWYSCFKKAVMVTTITVKCANNLEKQTAFGGEFLVSYY